MSAREGRFYDRHILILSQYGERVIRGRYGGWGCSSRRGKSTGTRCISTANLTRSLPSGLVLSTGRGLGAGSVTLNVDLPNRAVERSVFITVCSTTADMVWWANISTLSHCRANLFGILFICCSTLCHHMQFLSLTLIKHGYRGLVLQPAIRTRSR